MSVFPILRITGMGLIELLARRYEKAPNKLIQSHRLLQALCHKFCRFNNFCFYASGEVNPISWRHFDRRNSTGLSFPGRTQVSAQENSGAGVLEAFLREGET